MKDVIGRISPADLNARITGGDSCQIVDVRESNEYRMSHVPNSLSIPLSTLASSLSQIDREIRVYLICQSGRRAEQAASILGESGFPDVCLVDGGLNAWMQAGCPLAGQPSPVWSMERQVRFAAGLLVLVGIVLGATVNATWICLSAFVALGMMFSAATNTCGMATLLGYMPWNRP